MKYRYTSKIACPCYLCLSLELNNIYTIVNEKSGPVIKEANLPIPVDWVRDHRRTIKLLG